MGPDEGAVVDQWVRVNGISVRCIADLVHHAGLGLWDHQRRDDQDRRVCLRPDPRGPSKLTATELTPRAKDLRHENDHRGSFRQNVAAARY